MPSELCLMFSNARVSDRMLRSRISESDLARERLSGRMQTATSHDAFMRRNHSLGYGRDTGNEAATGSSCRASSHPLYFHMHP